MGPEQPDTPENDRRIFGNLTSHLRERQRPHRNPQELELHLAQRVHPARVTNDGVGWGGVGRVALG